MQLELHLTATMIAFPLARQRRRVIEVARFILDNDDTKAVPYWRGVVRDLSHPLLVAGVPRPQVEAEVRRFHDAVQDAMVILDRGCGQIGGAG